MQDFGEELSGVLRTSSIDTSSKQQSRGPLYELNVGGAASLTDSAHSLHFINEKLSQPVSSYIWG